MRDMNKPIRYGAKGYKQRPEHVAKRKRFGPHNAGWKGDHAKRKSGNCRARRMYPTLPPCVKCGSQKAERHHKDGNPLNNVPDNIIPVCRKCHMSTDGRYDAFKTLVTARVPDLLAERHAAKRRNRCNRIAAGVFPCGHPYEETNIQVCRGTETCHTCYIEYYRNYRRKQKREGGGNERSE